MPPVGPKYGKVAYDAYFANCGGKSLIPGSLLPSWEAQAEGIKAAWEAAGEAVAQAEKQLPM